MTSLSSFRPFLSVMSLPRLCRFSFQGSTLPVRVCEPDDHSDTEKDNVTFDACPPADASGAYFMYGSACAVYEHVLLCVCVCVLVKAHRRFPVPLFRVLAEVMHTTTRA